MRAARAAFRRCVDLLTSCLPALRVMANATSGLRGVVAGNMTEGSLSFFRRALWLIYKSYKM